ncbi:MAG: hypothetical protein M0000_03310 [Actinomycetota bacterium]|nr:hypothetical protein [Actinomycetota bacterium]MDA8207577.1 hypothetical protein [Actinomycetota bacterium]
MTAANSTSEAFDRVAAAIVAARGADGAQKVPVAPGRDGYAVFTSASGLYAVLSASQPLDATGILLHAIRSGAKRANVSVLALQQGSRLRAQAETLAGVLAYQLSCFNLDFSVELVLSSSESIAVSPAPSLEVGIGVPVDRGVDLALTHGGVLVSRYGETFLEHMGIPYAKVEGEPPRLRPGVSEAENELLEAADPASARLGETLEQVRGVIHEKRTGGGFGPLSVELRSRWLAEQLLAQPDVLGAESLERVDIVRFGVRGAYPFGDMSPTKSGFWGTSRDVEDFLLARGNGRYVLWGVAAAMDPGVVLRAAEVAATLESELPGLSLGVAVSTKGLAIPYLTDLAGLARGGAAVVALSEPASGSLIAEVVRNGN